MCKKMKIVGLSKRYLHRSSCYTQETLFGKKDISRETLPRAYQPKEIEYGWYEYWESRGYFKPNNYGNPFTLLLPPPNVTGSLHLGHALTGTVQDVLSRWRRMKGDSVLWIPGVDHAGIATQVVVEKYLQKKFGISKNQIGREGFVEKVWEWKEEKEERILQQLRELGLSLEWGRKMYTMDTLPTEAVKTAFIELFERGLIYRADSLVNWSCALQSSISDIEVEFKEIPEPIHLAIPGCSKPIQFGVLTEFAYSVHNSDLEIIVATTRPETMLGDTGIALHTNDPRRQQLEGKFVLHPLENRLIPIIFDSFVDREFGTGAVKLTPAHSAVDWEMGRKHSLEMIPVFDETGRILRGELNGMHRLMAREAIIQQLDVRGLLRGKKPHAMQIPICSRSGDVVELLLRPQWFLNCKDAAQLAIDAVKFGNLKLIPENSEKIWFNWLENIRDWNISRQLWWGHQIPAYQASNGDEKIWIAARDYEDAMGKAQSLLRVDRKEIKIVPETDVLDTWFSSGIFPLFSLGWPKTDKEFENRFPFPLLETGNDILFFWVARMVMLSLMLTGRLPFEKVVLHGVVCDAHGRKMSKSLGNVVAPEDVIFGATLAELAENVVEANKRGLLSDEEVGTSLAGQKKLFPQGIPECGVDALRFTLCSQAIQSGAISFDVPTCFTNKLFCNKILQAFKFLLASMDKETREISFELIPYSLFDKWIISRLAAAVNDVDNAIQEFQLHLATQTLKKFFYNEICDTYLEAVKPILRSDNEAARLACLSCLFRSLETGLKLLHPFMPYLSEEIYQRLPLLSGFKRAESIMVADFPDSGVWAKWRNPELDHIVDKVLDMVSAVRKMKALYGTKGEKPDVVVVTFDAEVGAFLLENVIAVQTISRANKLSVLADFDNVMTEGYLKETIDERLAVFAKLKSDGQVYVERLEPTLKREEKVRLQLAKLQKWMETTGNQAKIPEETRARNMNKIKALQLQLDKILEIKKLLQDGR